MREDFSSSETKQRIILGFFLPNNIGKDPIEQKSFPEILLAPSDCRIAGSCFIFERRVVMEVWIKEMALK